MKHLLFRAIPPESDQSQTDWANFLSEVSSLQLPRDSQRLSSNVWLLPDDDRAYLCLSGVGQRNGIETWILPFFLSSDWQPLSSRP